MWYNIFASCAKFRIGLSCQPPDWMLLRRKNAYIQFRYHTIIKWKYIFWVNIYIFHFHPSLDLLVLVSIFLVLVLPFLLPLRGVGDDDYGRGDLNIDLPPDVSEVPVGLGLSLLALGQASTEQRCAIGSLRLLRIWKKFIFNRFTSFWGNGAGRELTIYTIAKNDIEKSRLLDIIFQSMIPLIHSVQRSVRN